WQARGGGGGACDADSEASWLYRLPFCDFGKVTDEPSADVSAHALEALAPEAGYDREGPRRPAPLPGATQGRGLAWRWPEREPGGSWCGRWGVNHVYGTGPALPALEACGVEPSHP